MTAPPPVAPPAEAPPAAHDALEASRGIVRGARLLSVVLLAMPAVRAFGDGGEGGRAAAVTALGFAVAALALWAAASWAQRHLLLGGTLRAHVRRGNTAAAAAVAASEVALALIASHAVTGAAAAELPAALGFGVLAVVTWVVFVALFRLVTTYPDGQEIAGENHAAALSYAGAALALAVIIGHAVDGPFQGWGRSLRAYGAALALAFALYPVRQLVVEGLLLGQRPRLRGGELDRAIGQRRSAGVAAVEAAAYVAAALVATGLG
jgi:uncharacterized membrane protein YjfL (UPF0719 family)